MSNRPKALPVHQSRRWSSRAPDRAATDGPQTFFPVPGLGVEQMEEIDELLEAGFENDQQTRLVMDDCLCCKGSKKAKNLCVDRQFTSGRRSTVMLTQRIFMPESRTAKIYTDIFCVSSFSDKREAKSLIERSPPPDSRT